MVAVEMMACGETHEVIAPLGIPSQSEGNGPSSAGSHRVVMFFMHLDVGSKLEATVFEVINALASDNGMRAEGVRNPIVSQETVQPNDTGIHHFDDEASRHALKRESCINTLGMLLYSVDAMLNWMQH